MGNYFSGFPLEDLMLAYHGYQKMSNDGVVGEDDFGGIFRAAIDYYENESRGYGIIAASSALLRTIAERWFYEHQLREKPLTSGDELWYVDAETGSVERAIVYSVLYRDGKLDSFSADFPDSGDFDRFFGSALGHCFFRSEADARRYIRDN